VGAVHIENVGLKISGHLRMLNDVFLSNILV